MRAGESGVGREGKGQEGKGRAQRASFVRSDARKSFRDVVASSVFFYCVCFRSEPIQETPGVHSKSTRHERDGGSRQKPIPLARRPRASFCAALEQKARKLKKARREGLRFGRARPGNPMWIGGGRAVMQTKLRFARRFSAGLQRPHALETARPMTPMRQRRLAPRAARTGMAPSGGGGVGGGCAPAETR